MRQWAWRVKRLAQGEPLLHDYAPVSMLRVEENLVPRAATAAVDAHNHLGRWLTRDGEWMTPDVPALVAAMDSCNVHAMVNLDGLWGDELEHNLDRYDRAYPGRFATFCHADWSRLAERGGTLCLVSELQRNVAAGARGLKVWKDLGLRLRDENGALIRPDEPRLSELWDAAGALGIPVLMHIGDPAAFFEPMDSHNERLEELLFEPHQHFADSGYPRWHELVDAFEAIVARHPNTRFIGAHVAGCAEDLARVSRMLDAYPNLFIDIGGRIGELGRQPRGARALILRHPDRVLWASDYYPPSTDAWQTSFRFLETEDEYFQYGPERIAAQGRWAIYGLGLPADVLQNVYRDNALGLINGLSAPS